MINNFEEKLEIFSWWLWFAVFLGFSATLPSSELSFLDFNFFPFPFEEESELSIEEVESTVKLKYQNAHLTELGRKGAPSLEKLLSISSFREDEKKSNMEKNKINYQRFGLPSELKNADKELPSPPARPSLQSPTNFKILD